MTTQRQPARPKQPGRRPTNEYLVRFEPEVFAALVELQADFQPVSLNALINAAVKQFCRRDPQRSSPVERAADTTEEDTA